MVTEVSEQLTAFIIRVMSVGSKTFKRSLLFPLITLMMEVVSSFETSTSIY
jgi:hypothetical protein